MAFTLTIHGIHGIAGPVTADELRSLGDAWDALWDESAITSSVLVCGEANSSLDVVRELTLSGNLEEWGAVWATTQRAGRGQSRRPWVSLPGNLHAAWRWPLPPPPGDDLVSCAAGVAIVRALRRFGVSAALKWPNDILLGPRKLGGILVERYLDFVFVGLGLNIVAAPAAEELHPDGAMPATCLKDHSLAFDLGAFWDELCDEAKLLAAALCTGPGCEAVRTAHAKYLARGFEEKKESL